MIAANPQTGYSALVQLQLLVNGREFELGSVGPDFITLREPLELPPCEAEVVMTVQHERDSWRVSLPNGCSRQSLRVAAIQFAP